MHEIITLDNGLRVVIEKISHVKSISIGVWVGAGSICETRENNGISHFIEHMVFKGTKKRTAKQIAEAIDDVGGHLNAFTTRESTCFYAKVLNDNADLAFDILSDMLFHSKFDQKDIDLERSVILEEISMYDDSPEDIANDVLIEKSWRGNSLCYPILGTKSSLKKVTRQAIIEYMERFYIPQNSVLSVVGNFEKENILTLINQYFSVWEKGTGALHKPKAPRFHVEKTIIQKEIEQTHLCIGYQSIPRGHRLNYSLMVVNTILGSGMSSKLFQSIREEKGLVYSIYSYLSAFSNAGMFTIYAAMNPARLDEVILLIQKEINHLIENGLTKEEVEKTKQQLKGNLILGLESTSSKMNSYAQSLLLTDKIRTMDEIIKQIDDVSTDTVKEAIEIVFAEPAITIVQK